jgi:hypothetical protein
MTTVRRRPALALMLLALHWALASVAWIVPLGGGQLSFVEATTFHCIEIDWAGAPQRSFSNTFCRSARTLTS